MAYACHHHDRASATHTKLVVYLLVTRLLQLTLRRSMLRYTLSPCLMKRQYKDPGLGAKALSQSRQISSGQTLRWVQNILDVPASKRQEFFGPDAACKCDQTEG